MLFHRAISQWHELYLFFSRDGDGDRDETETEWDEQQDSGARILNKGTDKCREGIHLVKQLEDFCDTTWERNGMDYNGSGDRESD